MIHAADLEQKDWMQTNKRVREFEQAAGIPVRLDVRFPIDFSLGQCEALSPWTSVNNCTKNRTMKNLKGLQAEPDAEKRATEALNAPSRANLSRWQTEVISSRMSPQDGKQTVTANFLK